MHVVMISKACIVGIYQRKLEELARLPDVQLTVIVPPSWRDSRGVTHLERAHITGYELLVTPLAFNGHFHLHFYPRLGRLLHRLRPDLLHIDEEPYNLATWQAMRIARRLSVPACFFTWQNLHRRYPPPFRWFERYNFRHAAYAIAGNHEAVSVLRAKGYAGPVSVIPQFGVDPDIFSPHEQGLGGRGEGLVIGYVGGLVPEKGVDLLLQAVANLVLGPWSLVIAGEGAEKPHLQTLAEELGVAARVRFVGRLPSTQMPDFYRSLDVLVLPSRTQRHWKEQFGRVLVEAMACAVPVVGSDCGEIPHVVGQAGLIFPEGDVAALRERLARLLGDAALRAELGRLGRQRVLAHYTQAQVAAATLQVYREMVRSGQVTVTSEVTVT
ncbi:MAG: glycosyltransferase [Anaerolineae bacterium]|nr:glycosyltransferase [Anaerolineae bacterium]